MTRRSCRHETDIGDAVCSGRWTRELLVHARACPICSDVRVVAEALRAPRPPARVEADPSLLWACGRHVRRLGAEARISLVVTAAEVAALVGVLAVLVSFVDVPKLWASWPALLSGGAWMYAAAGLLVFGLSRASEVDELQD
jgi:hypothetical protein